MNKKDYIPNNVKLNTCAAVAYNVLTGVDYDEALKILPNGKHSTIQSAMDKLGVPQFNKFDGSIRQFIQNNRKGKFFVCLNQNNQGHAVAVIDGIAYNMQNFSDNAKVDGYYDLSSISKVTNDTAYVDQDQESADISKNKYALYAYQQIIQKLGQQLAENGKVRTKLISKNSNGFTIDINNRKIDFEFPFNCSDKEVIKQIDDTVERFCRKIV